MSFTYQKASEIALKLGCDPATILAVAEVESGGRHDLPDGRPQILFEAHWFSKLTGHKFDDTHPNISSREWNRSLYKGGSAEWGRLNAAIELDANAALQSASWGLFQIMGFNYKACGFNSVAEFVSFIKGPDDNDMEAFVHFVRANPKILQAMKARDWKTFALHYNGPGAVAAYSAKMADAYAKFAGYADREREGPPIPVSDPTGKAPVLSKKTVAAAAGAAATAAPVVIKNVQPTIDAIQSTATAVQQAGSAWTAIKDAFGTFQNGHVLTVFLLLLSLGLAAYVVWRIWNRKRNGEASA